MKFSVWSDGSSDGNSIGAMGYGFVIVIDNEKIVASGSGGAAKGSNNIAELLGAIEGLKALILLPQFINGESPQEVELVSDSRYVLGLASGSYSATKNVELAEEIRNLCIKYSVKTIWIEGHTGVHLNEIADRLAKYGKSQFLPPKIIKKHIRRARRKRRLTVNKK